jgi:hypothetical protein
MDEDFTAFDFPELKQAPNISFDDPFSLNSLEENSFEANFTLETKSDNIRKIHEYLDGDMADQRLIIDRLKEFERKLDEYIQHHQRKESQ